MSTFKHPEERFVVKDRLHITGGASRVRIFLIIIDLGNSLRVALRD